MNLDKIIIRIEEIEDYNVVNDILTAAFEPNEQGLVEEAALVKRLRKDSSFEPEFSLVAILNDQLIGHILLTEIDIILDEISFKSLALAPVSVLPKYQRMGVGSKLILAAHDQAIKSNYKSICLIGHADYYPRFGYHPASQFGIKFPFEAPDENCMAVELVENGLDDVSGVIKYPDAFFG